jgi:hypothetical protein
MPAPRDLKRLFEGLCLLEPKLCESVIEFFCGYHKVLMTVTGPGLPSGTMLPQ